MIYRDLCRKLQLLLVFTIGSLIVLLPTASPAQKAIKVVKTQDDLPRFNYSISGTATDLVKSDDATFNAFASKIQADLDSVLIGYDIQDHATLRSLLGVQLALQVLSGKQDKVALNTIAKLRDLEDKPDAKLLSGIRTKAYLTARIQTGQSSGPTFNQAYIDSYTAALSPLPWAVVANRVKEAKSSAQLISEALLLGGVHADIDPAVAKSHQLSNELAWGLINTRLALKTVLPLKDATSAVLAHEIAINAVQKADIWEAREVTLTPADKLTPVNVAIWDTGTDLNLFPIQTFTDPHPAPEFDPHGLAFDLKGFPSHGDLLPLTADQAKAYLEMRDYMKGLPELQLSIDSPEANGLKKRMAGLTAAEIPGFLESLAFYSVYSHGTQVAGIAARGNPAIRLAVARITFDWHNVPLLPNEELSKRSAEDATIFVKWFQSHAIRVVNMSWIGGPLDIETALEKNGAGKDAAERKAMAKRLFAIEREGLFEAIKSAPEILFICAAGNADANSSFNEMIPSSFRLSNLLTVGAVDQAGDEASFTSYGETVRVDADGYQVESVLPGGAKARFSGTSMAAPNAVNLAAKLLALDPNLTPEQVIKYIIDGATPSEDGRRHNINPLRSIELLKQLQTTSAR